MKHDVGWNRKIDPIRLIEGVKKLLHCLCKYFINLILKKMEKKMKTVSKIKLNQLSKNEILRRSQMGALKGGCRSDCACACYVGTPGENNADTNSNDAY